MTVVRAARVVLTCEELSKLLDLPEGHRIHAVAAQTDAYLPGISVTIVDDRPRAMTLPQNDICDPVHVLDYSTYLRYVAHGLHAARDNPRNYEYKPARDPITASDPKAWPEFPGQNLPTTRNPVHSDPGDESTAYPHMGGPR